MGSNISSSNSAGRRRMRNGRKKNTNAKSIFHSPSINFFTPSWRSNISVMSQRAVTELNNSERCELPKKKLAIKFSVRSENSRIEISWQMKFAPYLLRNFVDLNGIEASPDFARTIGVALHPEEQKVQFPSFELYVNIFRWRLQCECGGERKNWQGAKSATAKKRGM